MIVLAITTSTDRGSVALLRKDKVIANKSWTRSKPHSEVLTLNVQGLLQKAHIKPKDLTLITVDCGPGSFTGARMAVNVVKTLAHGLGVKIFSVPSLDIMAAGAASSHKGKIVALLDAHKSLLYFRSYESDGKKITSSGAPISAVSIEEVISNLSKGDLVIGGISKSAIESLKAAGAKFSLKKDLNSPQARILAQMATLDSPSKVEFIEWRDAVALYVRSPDVLEKLK